MNEKEEPMIALIDEYRKELLDIAGYAPKTVDTYISSVIRYYEYAKVTLNIDPIKSKGEHILKWIKEIRKHGISGSRMQHHSSALKLFFAFLMKLKIVKKNPAQNLPRLRKRYSELNKPVSKGLLYRLLRFLDQSTWHGMRDFVIISMLWSLGLRVSELTSLRVKSFEPDHGVKTGLLRVKGKNKKQRALFVVDKLYDVLFDYLKHPESPKKKNDPMFPIKQGTSISKNRVLKMIKEYALKANIKVRITPHVLRHSFATEMYHQGVPLPAIQAMMGHVNKAETSIYIHVSDAFQKQALEQITLHGRLSWE
jgi:integrase/recombinase XerD